MIALYWFALVVGAGMFLFSVFGDASHGDGAGAGHEGAGADLSGHDQHAGDGFRILSLRNATYLLFAFGTSGVLLTLLWKGGHAAITALVAVALGVLGAAMSTIAFGWLRKSESGDLPPDSSWAGAAGSVVLPLSATGTGKISVTRGQRVHELLARPYDDTAPSPETWMSVFIVEMRHGVAFVSPNDPVLGEVDPPRLSSTSEL